MIWGNLVKDAKAQLKAKKKRTHTIPGGLNRERLMEIAKEIEAEKKAKQQEQEKPKRKRRSRGRGM